MRKSFQINLPPKNHPVRDLLDIAYVARILSPAFRNLVLTIPQAVESALEFFKSEKAARGIYQIVSNLDHSQFYFVELSSRNGGNNVDTKVLWQFA